ncbi:hypothetical protein DOE63_15875 [Salmonella enterica subsp. diarizonae serovar 59:z10:-]|nr:hypothetical protein DOE63_15875 [Salmonella enterica subsp. diarizonae serovar 59:z10:-]
MKANSGVRCVFREWPIFARNWLISMSAAQTGLHAWKQKGADVYLACHNGVFAIGSLQSTIDKASGK